MNAFAIWRLTPERHETEAFSGEGAATYGGRWNPPGVPMVYCAESRALAALEVLANIRDTQIHFAQAWVVIPVNITEELLEKPVKFPPNWNATPYPAETQEFGAAWAKAQRSVVLRVPSAVVMGEFNYLLNPAHPDYAKVKIGKAQRFTFDPRLK